MSRKRLSTVEFVAMMAMLFSMVAFSIDSMLPGLPGIAADLSPQAPNHAQLVVTSFMFGMGLGTFFSGPLSDAYGRRVVVSAGIAVFILGAILAWHAPTLELLLAARFVQGLGVAGPRIAPLAMIRDLYEGRRMAQLTSFVTMVFMIVPALAPSLGALIITQWNWRAIFPAFVVFSLLAGLWLNIRQGETLNPQDRRPFRPAQLREGFLEVMTNPVVLIAILALSLEFGALVGLLSSTQQIYSDVFGRAKSFPLWFAGTALIASLGTMLNAWAVMRLGMRRLVLMAFAAQFVVSAVCALIFASGALTGAGAFALWFFWSSAMLFFVGLIMGNLNALALQPLGHVAGMAASLISAISTVIGVLIAVPVGLAFNGTPLPLVSAAALFSAGGGLLVYLRMKIHPSS